MLTSEQIIKIENWKAQHNSLLGNIQDASNELGDILQHKDIAEQNLKTIKLGVLSEYTKLAEILKSIQQTENKLKITEKDIKQGEFELECVNRAIIEEEEKFNSIENEKRKVLSDLGKKASDIEVDIVLAEIQLEDRQDKYEIVDKQVKEKIENNRNLDIVLSGIKGGIECNQKLFDKNYSIQKQTLQDIKNQIADEMKKIELPRKSVKEREDVLKQREKDFSILVARLQRLYREVKPGISLSI